MLEVDLYFILLIFLDRILSELDLLLLELLFLSLVDILYLLLLLRLFVVPWLRVGLKINLFCRIHLLRRHRYQLESVLLLIDFVSCCLCWLLLLVRLLTCRLRWRRWSEEGFQLQIWGVVIFQVLDLPGARCDWFTWRWINLINFWKILQWFQEEVQLLLVHVHIWWDKMI